MGRQRLRGQWFDQNGVPLGSELSVSNEGAADLRASFASDSSVIATWNRFTPSDGSSSGVFGRRLSSIGEALGVEFQVNTYTTNAQRLADVAAGTAGDFLVVWQSEGQDGSGSGVFSRYFPTPAP